MLSSLNSNIGRHLIGVIRSFYWSSTSAVDVLHEAVVRPVAVVEREFLRIVCPAAERIKGNRRRTAHCDQRSSAATHIAVIVRRKDPQPSRKRRHTHTSSSKCAPCRPTPYLTTRTHCSAAVYRYSCLVCSHSGLCSYLRQPVRHRLSLAAREVCSADFYCWILCK